MVSPKPLSDFVPEVTLIAFPNSRRDRRAVTDHFSREPRFASRQENGLDTDIESEFRRKPELAPARSLRRFRRLFAEAQSTAASKLANPLTSR
jgi:hypothetical protein